MANSQTVTFNIKAVADMKDVVSNIQQIQSALSRLKMPEGLKTSFNKTFSDLEKETAKYQELLGKGFKTKGDASAFTKSGDNILRLYDELVSKINSIDDSALKNMFKDLGTEEIQKLKQELNGLQESLKTQLNGKDFASGFKNSLQEIRNKFKETNKDASELVAKLSKSTFNTFTKNLSEGRLDLAANNLKSIKEQIDALGDAKPQELENWINQLDTAFQKLKSDSNIQETITQLEQIKSKLTGAEAQAIQRLIDGFKQFRGAVSDSNKEVQTLVTNEQQAAANAADFNRELGQVKSRIQYFLGLNNAINLVKRAIRGAVDTVKELDAAMTETAVVTDHTVSDMWAKLPEYTKRANDLGVSTLAAYKSATLYYQQGLNDEQAAALSVETLKMARIAGLEAADATDRMTNALRGFNMELNEVSAQKVDDVYSQLAAMSASNVDEISTAMTKVASLAHNANMEFETTAAFLAQIIETTRESAETAGTALKTVVARFSEVKKLYDMDELKGQDEEGQSIDVNRVSSALRTAGIDLNKYFLGEVGLDDIFMELASKWDSLTSVQQRYIATQAAGSRQQSRFIALMQDYARTQQLVSAAYNANGASARQFEKTQESLQSKLARLKNAWDAFLMGLANNAVIKGAVDLLTLLLNTVNNLTSAFGDGVGGILKWVAAIGAIGGLRSAFSDNGIATKAIGALIKGTPIGNLLGKARETTALQGSLTTNGQGSRQATIIGNVGGIGKGLWGGVQHLGRIAGYNTALGGKMAGGFMSMGATEGLAAGLTGIVTALGAVAAAVGVVVAAYTAWLELTPEGQLKQANQIADAMNKVASNAQKTASSYKNVQKSYQEYSDAVESSSSISERQTAIQNRNDYITQLLESDPAYAEYISSMTDESGQFILTLDESALAAAVDKISDSAVKTAIASQMAQANVNAQQAQVYEARIASIQRRLDNPEAYAGLNTKQLELDLIQYQNQLASLNQSAQNQISASARQMLTESNLDSELANKLADAYASVYDSDEYQKAFDTYNLNAFTRVFNQGARKQEYESIFGVGSAKGMDRKEIADALAGYRIENEQQSRLDATAQLIKSGGYDQILDAIAGNIDFDEKDITKATDKIRVFGETIGKSTTEIVQQIRQSQAARKEIKKNNQINAYDRFLRSGAANERNTIGSLDLNPRNATTAIDNFSAFLEGLNYEGLAAVNDITAQAETLLGNKLGEFMVELPKLYGTSDFNSIQKLFNNVNLDEPIKAFHEINRYVNDTTSAVGRYANAIREANAELFTSSNLVKSFIASADYENITEQLEAFIKENEAITADNINELADSCEELNYLLEDGIASAEALAEAFTLIETGKIAFDNITDSLLKALDAGKNFGSVIADVQNWIKNFDKGIDLTEGSEHVISVLEELQEYVSNWEFGNEPVEKIYDHLFGEGKYQSFLDSFVNGFDPEEAESILTGKIEEFTHLFENEGLGAIEKLAGDIPGLEALGNGLFSWDLDEIGSTTEAIGQVAEKLNITEEAAESLILAWQTHIPGLRKEWNELAFDEQVQKYSESLNNTKVVTEQELSALAAATGHSVDEIKAKLAELAQQGKIEMPIIVNWQDENGNNLTGNDLYSAFAEKFGKLDMHGGLAPEWKVDWGAELAKAVTTEFENGIKGYDPSKVLSYFNEKGVFGDQANELANRAIEAAGGKFTKEVEIPVVYKVEENGEETFKTETKTITVEADTVEGLDTAIDTALQTANYESVATAIATQDFSGLSDSIATAGESGGARAATAVETAINGIHPSVEVSVTYVPTNPEVLSGAGAAGGIVVSVARGGIAKSYASGSASNHLSPGAALTGEEGPEIIWNKEKGYAYVTGENHPEFQNLQPGDRVFNAQETKKILSGAASGGLVDSFAQGGWKTGDSSSKKSSGGGGRGNGGADDKTPEEWKNDLDWLYNLMEDIAELERDQKAIEEQYEDYLSDQTKTGGDLYRLLVKQLGNLYTQLEHQNFALQKREQEMREFMDVTNDQDQYLWYNWQDRTIEIDWDAIDQIRDEDQYKHVKELIDEAEEIQDKIDDADDAIMDITNQIQELENIWRDTFTDFEDRVLDAIVKSYQQVIDKYSELNDTLNNSNTQILDSLQKQISLERQIRDNTKTEEEISDEEARLAYLRRDTSGGNELAALQLEKELADQRENYEDTLVDQAISRLQEDNDAAAQQRERQIEIMQAQLDYQSENGEFNAYISDLLTTAMGADGELLTNSDLVTLLKEQENWDAMSAVSKEVWDEELNGTFKEVAAFLLKQNAEQNGTFYTALTAAVNSVSSAIGSYSQAMVKLGSSLSGAGGYSSAGGGSSGGGSSSGSTDKTSQSSSIINKLGGAVTNFFKQGTTSSKYVGGCFAKGTSILMDNNIIKAIEDIKIGETVMAYDENAQIFVPKKVTKAYIHHNTPSLVKLTFNNGEILNLTPGHPLYSTNGWKSLDIENSLYEHGTITTLLKLNDTIIGINGNAKVIGIEFIDIGLNYDTYNIEVEDCHTFLANGFVAHNMKVHYATGGLADSTGLAWLDGTPQEPEYVLNARQTDAFLKLADVLPSMMNGISTNTSNTFGSTYLNVSVNLESVSPDYDVDRMVDLVKDKLYDAGSYRNINSLSFLR